MGLHNPDHLTIKGRFGRPRRRGWMAMELVVSSVLLLSVMSGLATMTLHVGRLWRQTRDESLALDELTNHLERLSRLSQEARRDAMNELEVSEEVRRVLPDAILTGEWVDDAYGRRIDLKLDWNRGFPSPPLQMVAWVDTSADAIEGREAQP